MSENRKETPEDYYKNRTSRKMSKISMEIVMNKNCSQKMKAYEWFLEPQFYLVTSLYFTAILFTNIAQSYITFYVQYALLLSQDMVAIIPMVIFISGFAVSLVMNFIVDRFGSKLTFLGSCLVGISEFILV